MIELSDMNAVRLVVIGIGLVGKKHAELVSASDTCSLAGSLIDAQRLVKTADDCGIQVLVGHHRRYNPLEKETRSLVGGGAIGKPVAVSVLWAL